MDRFKQAEKLSATARDGLPKAAVLWLAAARAPLERLTMAALDPEISDATFVRMIEQFRADLPQLMEKLDHDAIAKPLEEAMGAAAGNGIGQRTPQESQ